VHTEFQGRCVFASGLLIAAKREAGAVIIINYGTNAASTVFIVSRELRLPFLYAVSVVACSDK